MCSLQSLLRSRYSLLALTQLPRTKQFFPYESMPARTCIGVSALPMGAFVEIECIAAIP